MTAEREAMSASERLGRLDSDIDPKWRQGEPLVEGSFRQARAIATLRNALPEIVAVVKAAEVASKDGHGPVHMHIPTLIEIDEALTALSRKLGEAE
jgi:hypothetical protein